MIPENYRKKVKISQLVIEVIQVILAIWIFRRPSNISKTFAVVAGLLLIFKGIYHIYTRNMLKETFNIKPNGMVVISVLDIIFGIIILFNLDLTSRIIIYLIGIYILARSIIGLFTFSPMKMLIPGYYFMSVAISFIGILIGGQILITPQISEYIIAFSMAVYILIDGIQNIVYGFLD